MLMAALQRFTSSVLQRTNCRTWPFRAHHSLSMSAHCQSSMGTIVPILFPRVAYLEVEAPDNSIGAAIRTPFMQLMAVPKRKVSPSRKGKRNGPKALKPVPVVAKCKVCGRIKLPQFYCCSGEGKVEEF